MQSGMKHVAIVKPINSVLVRGTAVQYDPDSNNVILGGPKHMEEACKHLSKAICSSSILVLVLSVAQSCLHKMNLSYSLQGPHA